jgi:hypothetical protein
MPALEDLLREELKRVTDTVQPGQLRPLLPPGPRRGPRPWLLPVAAGAAVVAVAAAAALLAGPPARQQLGVSPPSASAPMPRYYVTAARTAGRLDAVVRDSASGAVTGTVPIPGISDAWGVSVTAAADQRTFVIATVLDTTGLPGTDWTLFFRLPVSPAGRPGQPTELNVSTQAMPLVGMALSPDGTMLAVSLEHEGIIVGTQTYGVVQVIDLATGKTRTWTGRSTSGYWPGAPSWGDGDGTLTFPWWRLTSPTTGAAAIVGVRQLDITAAGGNLLQSQLMSFPAAVDGVQSAMITSGGYAIVAAACHDTSPPGHSRGTVTARIIELSAADGQLLRVLRTQTARYANLGEQGYLDGGCAVLSVDPSGSHLLVQDFQFGRIDNGVFTALPGASADVTFVAAGW